jgi:hypothetical protein
MNRQAMIDEIRAVPGQIEQIVAGLSTEQLTTAYLPGEWSVAQIVHHIADSHLNSYVRCKLMATEENPTLRPYDEKAWAQLPDGASADLSYSLALLRSLHTRWALFWENLGETEWQRTGFHPESGTLTLERQLENYVQHGRDHLDQIRRTLRAAQG